MGVDEAGKDDRVAEIDHLSRRAGLGGPTPADRPNAAGLDDQPAVFDRHSHAREQVPGAEHDAGGRHVAVASTGRTGPRRSATAGEAGSSSKSS